MQALMTTMAALSFTPGLGLRRTRVVASFTPGLQLRRTRVAPPRSFAANPPRLFKEELNLIYDSKCGVCQWEVDFLKARDPDGKLTFTDLEGGDFEENAPRNGNLDYETALASFHAVKADGTLLSGMPVFQAAYSEVGLGWVWRVYDNKFMARLLDLGYALFARYRTDLTRGSSLEALYAARKAATSADACASSVSAPDAPELSATVVSPPLASSPPLAIPSPPAFQSINALTLCVSDMSRSCTFYSRLGLSLSFGGPDAPFSTFSATAEPASATNNAMHINLMRAPDYKPAAPQPGAPGGWGRAVIFVEDVDALHAHLIQSQPRQEEEPGQREQPGCGLETLQPPRDAPWGERFFHVSDPDGHELSFATPDYAHPRWGSGGGEGGEVASEAALNEAVDELRGEQRQQA